MFQRVRLRGPILCLCLSIVGMPVAAQESESPPEQAPDAGDAAQGVGGEQARKLAELLQDEPSRDALVKSLLAISAKAEGTAPEEPEVPPAPASVAQRIAEESGRIAQSAAEVVTSTTRALLGIGDLFSEAGQDRLEKITQLLRSLGLVIAVTLGVFYLLRLVANRIRRALGLRAAGRLWLARMGYLLIATVVDAGSVGLAWAAGYSFALSSVGKFGMGLSSILFLNAFLLIELVKATMRALFSPRYGNLRLLPLGNETGGYWGFWVNRTIGLLGYGMMLLVPVVSAELSAPAGRGIGVVIALTGLVMGILVVLQNKLAVRRMIEDYAHDARSAFETRMLKLIARTWHLAAIVYFVAIFVIWSTRAVGGLRFMLTATGQSAVAVVLGVLLVGFISRWVTGGMRLPEDLRTSLPLLERRLNAYVPAILTVVRLLVMALVAAAIAHAWGIFDVLKWARAEAGREILIRLFSAAAVLLVGLVLHTLVSSWVEFRLSNSVGQPPSPRERTLLSLFRNAFTVTLVVITIMLTLGELGVNIAPLLAGAGVVGLAVGFGAQKLVQDVITGAFIQLENAMNEGDVVTVAGVTGTVEKLTIRSVGLRDLHGIYHVIPFSSADSVSNYMKGFSYYVAELGVAYRENVDEVKQLMQEAFDRLGETDHAPNLLGPLEMHGLTTFGDSAVNVRARIKTVPGTQWGIGRAYNEIIKTIFDERGIEIPFPHLTVYMGEDKAGNAPPIRVTGVQGSMLPVPENT